MSSKHNEKYVEEWLAMDIPHNQLSEDEYDLDEDETYEKAQQLVHNIDSILLKLNRDNNIDLETFIRLSTIQIEEGMNHAVHVALSSDLHQSVHIIKSSYAAMKKEITPTRGLKKLNKKLECLMHN